MLAIGDGSLDFRICSLGGLDRFSDCLRVFDLTLLLRKRERHQSTESKKYLKE